MADDLAVRCNFGLIFEWALLGLRDTEITVSGARLA